MDRMNHGARPDRPHLEGMGTSEETVALWEEVTGKSADDLDWYLDFTGFKTALLSIRTTSFMDLPQPSDEILTQMLHRSRS
jgi:hypothetical protein